MHAPVTDLEQQLQALVEAARAQREAAEQRLREARADEQRMRAAFSAFRATGIPPRDTASADRPMPQQRATGWGRRSPMTVREARSVCLQLGVFSVNTLAERLDCSPSTARSMVQRLLRAEILEEAKAPRGGKSQRGRRAQFYRVREAQQPAKPAEREAQPPAAKPAEREAPEELLNAASSDAATNGAESETTAPSPDAPASEPVEPDPEPDRAAASASTPAPIRRPSRPARPRAMHSGVVRGQVVA